MMKGTACFKICKLTSPSSQKRSNNVTPRCLSEKSWRCFASGKTKGSNCYGRQPGVHAIWLMFSALNNAFVFLLLEPFFCTPTDQCKAMQNALRSTMPHTRHRWCRWHVLKVLKEKTGHVYNKHSAFKKEFHAIVNEETDVESFERRWHQLIKKIQTSRKQVPSQDFQMEGHVGNAILHGHILCRNDQHATEWKCKPFAERICATGIPDAPVR